MLVYSSPVLAPSAPTDGRAGLLARRAYSAIALGNWPEASYAADACLALADLTMPDVLARGLTAAGTVAAVRGDAMTARGLLRRSEVTAVALGSADLLDLVQLGWGLEALGADRYDEAWARLHQVVDADGESSAWIRLIAVGYLAEAGLRCHHELAARTSLAHVERAAHLAATPGLRGATAYARAITRGEIAADTAFDRALAECPGDRAFDRARINLARGVWLRRERRVSESRTPLHEALVAFERLGAKGWADQARNELRATGARRVRRELGDVETLTTQELQIVRMAAAGLTNREIGQRLYLSHRTIGSHLYRAFPKLGIAARSQLRDVLAEVSEEEGLLQGVAR